MNEQIKSPRKQFCIEKAFQKGPLHLLHSFRVGQLQNKVNFFEGQVDPLLDENVTLKDQLITLSKLVDSSSEILRHLLPTFQDPNKRLKLQMATIEEIATMIQEDWRRMEGKLADNAKAIKKLREERDHWKDCFEEEKAQRARQVLTLQQAARQSKIIFEAKIASLESSVKQLAEAHQEQKRLMREDFQNRVRSYWTIEKQFERYRRDAKDREEEYDKKIIRLRNEIEANVASFQETKKNLKGIYDKLMNDKLSEQAQGFQLLLKMKEEEKMQVIIAMGEAEEEYRRKAAQKESEIARLSERNDSYRQEVGQLKDDIWKKQLQLDKQFQEGRSRDQLIAQLQAEKRGLSKKIEQNEQEYLQQKKILEKVIKRKEDELKILKEQGSASLQKVLTQKAELEKQMAEKQQKLRQTLLTLRKKDQVWEQQVAKLRQEWQMQEEAIKSQLQEEQKINRIWSAKLQESERKREQIIKQNQERLKRIEDIHKEQQYILECKYQAKISTIQEAQEMQMNQLKILHQRELAQANISANDSLREVIASCNRRMTEQQTNFLAQRSNFEKEIKQRESQIKSAEKRAAEAAAIMERSQIQHQEALRQITAIAQREKERLQKQMNYQMKAFQQEMEKQEARLNQIKAIMEKEIQMLKEANAIETIETRFLNQINKLKEQFAQTIKKTQQDCKKHEEALAEEHKSKIQELKETFNQDLIQIVEKVEQKNLFLNDRLITGFNEQQINGMSEDEKKQYIIKKVEEIKQNNFEKQKKINELQEALDFADKNVEKRVKARKEELEKEKERFARECSQKVESITNECKTKVAEAERDRVQHSQAMYIEFQTLRQHHQGVVNALNKKYNQLETLFQERPSRMEDLTKIKQLINMQTKLDIQIQSYQKKMETANEIVKYLNLQLENYKDSYDIFGPNGQNLAAIGIVGVSPVRNSNPNPNTGPDTQHILQVIKSHRHGSEAKILSNEDKKEQLAYSRWNDTASPVVKDLKLFQDDQSEHSAVQSRDFSEPKEDKKYSYLMVDKGSERRTRFKTDRTEKVEHESEILINAENFIKLIKGSQVDGPPPVVKEVEERKKSYRKRKLHKRHPTQGFDHYF